jgi:outer membrane protein assembly factor BamE
VLKTAKPILSKLRTGLTASALAIALSACGTTNWGFPYRPNVQQGNWITSEQVAQLRQGMTRDQVRFILGTPTLQDIFRSNRWDYPYFNKPGYGATQERKFTVWFNGDTLDRWEGDPQPDRQPFQKTDTGMQRSGSDAQSKGSDDDQADTPKSRNSDNHSDIQLRPVNPSSSSPNGSSAQPLL